MDGNRFDNLVRTLAVPRSRRAAFEAVVGLTAGALLGARSGVTGAAARKVGVCHRTGSSRNLYQFLIVDENAVDTHRAHGDAVGVDLQTDLANCGSCGVVCPISTNPCLAAACQNGACGFVPANEGGACNDGNACSQVDTCRAGVCIGSNPVLCTALDQCHIAGNATRGRVSLRSRQARWRVVR